MRRSGVRLPSRAPKVRARTRPPGGVTRGRAHTGSRRASPALPRSGPERSGPYLGQRSWSAPGYATRPPAGGPEAVGTEPPQQLHSAASTRAHRERYSGLAESGPTRDTAPGPVGDRPGPWLVQRPGGLGQEPLQAAAYPAARHRDTTRHDPPVPPAPQGRVDKAVGTPADPHPKPTADAMRPPGDDPRSASDDAEQEASPIMHKPRNSNRRFSSRHPCRYAT